MMLRLKLTFLIIINQKKKEGKEGRGQVFNFAAKIKT